jgi:tRNA-Thr(GGU) m(6)t(6)A37 methyltransferase TsaA
LPGERSKVAHKSARWNGQPLSLTPIGVLRSPFGERVEAPRQPQAAEQVEGQVELFPGQGYEDALSDLASFDHIWLVVWFDRNASYRPRVLPPRSSVKRGVFATRSPYRPNPIGLSAVRLLRVEGLQLFVRGLDLLDGTPVLDVKPYVPYSDAIPEANHGWLEAEARQAARDPAELAVQGSRPSDPLQDYTVRFDAPAAEQLAYLLTEHGVDLRERIEAVLRLGPAPHAYRRIRREADGFVLSLKDWRVRFCVPAEPRTILVTSLHSGYRPRELFTENGGAPTSHRAFVTKWATLLP